MQIQADLGYAAVPTGLPPEQERELLQQAFLRYPHFRAETLRRLADVETRLGNLVAAAAYRIRVVRKTGMDAFNDLIEAAELLARSNMPMAARSIAELVLSGEFNCTDEAKARANRLLQDVSLPPAEPPEFTKVLDSRTKSRYRVSYIFSLYNEEARAERAFMRYAQQTLYKQGEVEYIFVDSHSPQGEERIFERLVRDYPHILYVKTEKRDTLYQAWNHGIELATGDFLGCSTPSDFLVDDGLEIMSRALLDHPDVDWVQGNIGEPRPVSRMADDAEDQRLFLDCSTGFSPLLVLLRGAYLTFTSSLFRRRLIDKMGKFDGGFLAAGDTEFKLRAAGNGKVLQLGRITGFDLDDGAPQLTVHPRAEIEHFIAEHRHQTEQHILNVCEAGALDCCESAADCFEEMLNHALGFRPAFVRETKQLVNLELAEQVAGYRVAAAPDSATNWNDAAVLKLVNTLARCMDMLALGAAESPRVEQVRDHNRVILQDLIRQAAQMSLATERSEPAVLEQSARPLAYGSNIW